MTITFTRDISNLQRDRDVIAGFVRHTIKTLVRRADSMIWPSKYKANKDRGYAVGFSKKTVIRKKGWWVCVEGSPFEEEGLMGVKHHINGRVAKALLGGG